VKVVEKGRAVTKYFLDQNYVRLVRREIASIARTMLCKERSYLCGARRISLLTYAIATENADSDLAVFAIVEMETAHLPLGDTIQHEGVQALADLQGEMEMAELWARMSCELACASLVARFGD